jgi:hypothetical protein
MDQGVSEALKKKYWCGLLKALKEVIDVGEMLENLKKINLKDDVSWTA